MRRIAFLGAAGALLVAAPAFGAPLKRKLGAIASQMPGILGVYARTLAPKSPLASYNSTVRFPTASIIKVLIVTTAYSLEERQPGVLDDTIVFHSSDLIGGSDFMAGAQDGQSFTVAELIVPAITLSDNTAANLLIGYLGVDAINATAARTRMHRTRLARKFLDYTAIAHHNDNVSTPADMAHLLYLIELGAHEGIPTIVSPQHCTAIVKVMLRQTDRDAIPAALPPRVAVANKTGEIEGTRNDIAIVEPFGESPLILAIMTKDAYDYGASYAAIHAVTHAIYASAVATSASG